MSEPMTEYQKQTLKSLRGIHAAVSITAWAVFAATWVIFAALIGLK